LKYSASPDSRNEKKDQARHLAFKEVCEAGSFVQEDEALAEERTSEESLNAVSFTQREIAAATVRVIERRILYRTEAVSPSHEVGDVERSKKLSAYIGAEKL
jgi:hypothetical protein